MSCWAIVPIKAPEQCKTRLAAVLSDAQRITLASAMLRHVVAAAQSASGVDRVCVLGPSRHDLPASTPLLADQGGGLNAELAHATHNALAQGVERVLIIAADLPALTPADVEALAAQPAGAVAIAPDRAGVGTNALGLPLPAAARFTFQFGPGSFGGHRAEIARLGLQPKLVNSDRLALDIDEAKDLADLPAAFRPVR